MRIEKKQLNVPIPDDALVKVTRMGNVIEIMQMDKLNSKISIQKIDKDHYIDLYTGEVKEYNHQENRKESIVSLYRTFRKLRGYINTNFYGESNELHVVLTYKENMQNTKKLQQDLEHFIKKLRYYKGANIEYITVIEPQKRGAWHAHILIKDKTIPKLFISNEDIAKWWGNGFTKTKSLEGVDNIGAYLSAYLTNVQITEEEAENSENKRIIKGGRLHLYPSGTNIYRLSKGIKKPESYYMQYKAVKKEIIRSGKPDYQKETIIKDNAENIVNIVRHEYYNTVRMQKQAKGDGKEIEKISKNGMEYTKCVFININMP